MDEHTQELHRLRRVIMAVLFETIQELHHMSAELDAAIAANKTATDRIIADLGTVKAELAALQAGNSEPTAIAALSAGTAAIDAADPAPAT